MAENEKDGAKVGPQITNVALPLELQGQVGKRLRESYAELVKQPIPDKFLSLLEELKKSEPAGDKS